jgi:hypothetical protein
MFMAVFFPTHSHCVQAAMHDAIEMQTQCNGQERLIAG